MHYTKIKIIAILIVLIIVSIIAVLVGSINIPLNNIMSNPIYQTIIFKMRIPRVLLAIFVGASLSVSGNCLQTMLKNPLASPYTLGISSGASLAAAIAIVLNLAIFGHYGIAIFAFFGAIATILFIINFSKLIDKQLSNETIILTGIILSFFLSSIISLILVVYVDDAKEIIFFMSGSLANKDFSHVFLIAPLFIILTMFLFFKSKKLDLLTFGEAQAHSLGVNVKTLKYEIIFSTAILTAISVAMCGVIGFVGLIIPHISRRIFGPKHYLSIPMSAAIGAIFLVIVDTISRTIIAPIELPVGAITSLIGAPFFIIIFFNRRVK